MSLIHALAPAMSGDSWTLIYPLTGVLTLTLAIAASAVASLPALLLSRGQPLASSTATHPLASRSSRNSILTRVPSLGSRSRLRTDHSGAHDRSYSLATFPSVTDVDDGGERHSVDKALEVEKEHVLESESNGNSNSNGNGNGTGGRSMSLSSHHRLGSLTGVMKAPSFLQSMAGRGRQTGGPLSALETQLPLPPAIHVQTDVEMSFEECKRKSAAGQSNIDNGGGSGGGGTSGREGPVLARSWSKGWA